ncbi:carbohydrate ABC transporter permease [Paenarthrobacter nicotinovorans]|uniref:carbohydrate ABC transporter permease n=1 Tax=Paenarthrobacter nicotinovorans TaxID=29320 RepID=UPI001662B1F6|nr:carbohydrate ABC transporter permease [Paenarthrobacter nicotinovorans]MBP2396368.1 multiple sugar transport system permease protein [Paenarthrobacter nicotinovorans]UKE97562.1 carbohydrate ABC transporter permease [Paenarthrobacter nicotinovorans]UKF02348.1 carbohydrate ABC transporter permease [Paenarthrobacter nicotinovorans]GGV25658.1 sugar ABC transporter permease [Paenarthrobacter nicotinovorans]
MKGSRTRLGADVALLVIGLCFAAPLLWLVLAAVDPQAGYQTKVPSAPSMINFSAVLTPELLGRPLLNSFVLSAGTALVNLLAAVLAAYPLSRYQSRFNKPFMYTVLFGTSLPVTAIMVPVYGLFVQLQLLDSMAATIFFMATTTLPMAIWMAKNFMDSVPLEFEEAAWMDGASNLTTLRTIVLPLMGQGLGVVFIFVFIQAWGNFFVPFILLLSTGKQPAAVSIFSFFGQHGAIAYGQLAAFSILYSVPVLVLYAVVSRGMGNSFAMSGAMKG